MTFHSTSQRRSGGRDEPAELRQLRKDYGGSLTLLKEFHPDWKEEDLLYALQEVSGDVEQASSRIIEGLTTQWGEVKTKKTQKSKTTIDRNDNRTSNQRGGTADRGPRTRG
ncbi:hypothetical protein BGZ65_007807, partial [Modicella reniformis]